VTAQSAYWAEFFSLSFLDSYLMIYFGGALLHFVAGQG
jgi:hypothetical protein